MPTGCPRAWRPSSPPASTGWRRAIGHCLLLAGRRAQAKWANLEAAEFYRRALEASKSLPELDPSEVAWTWEALGDCLQLAGALEAAADAFGRARALVPKRSAALVELM